MADPKIFPIESLSSELLCEIFLHSAPTSQSPSEIAASFHPRHGPMLLTQVCQKWRDTAIATPQLWTTLRVDIYKLQMDHQAQQAYLDGIEKCVARAGVLPFTVCIIDINQGTCTLVKNPVVQALFKLSDRWKELHLILMFDDMQIWSTLAVNLRNRLPLLQECSISYWRLEPTVNSFDKDRKPITYLFSMTPKLQSFRLNYQFHISSFKMKTEKITSLTIYPSQTIEECLSILATFPNLIELRINCTIADPTGLPPGPSIISPSLQLLHLIVSPVYSSYKYNNGSDGGLGGLDQLFARLALPSLKGLMIDSRGTKRAWDVPSFYRMLEQTSKSVERFNFACDNISWSAIVDYLRLMPRLMHLKVVMTPSNDNSDISFTDNILDSFNSGMACLVPHLKYLEVEGRICLSPSTLLNFVEARWRPANTAYSKNRLWTLIVHADEESHDFKLPSNVLSRLAELSNEGMLIRIEKGTSTLFPVSEA